MKLVPGARDKEAWQLLRVTLTTTAKNSSSYHSNSNLKNAQTVNTGVFSGVHETGAGRETTQGFNEGLVGLLRR